MRCPNVHNLKSFLGNGPSDPNREILESHIESCLACQELLEQITAGDHSPRFVYSPSLSNDFVNRVADRIEASVSQLPPLVTKKNRDSPPGGYIVGEYEIVETIGEGGMGVVCLARHRRLDRLVALKIINADNWNNAMGDNKRVVRFQRELKAIGKLQHANIVSALDAGEHENLHYLAMEYINGLDLGQLVDQTGPLDFPVACEIIRQAAEGLQHSHQAGLVHRDVKPSNIMVALSDDGVTVKLLDLGLASFSRLLEERDGSITESGMVVGSIDYMAPEQMGGDTVDIRADVFSLGATLYFLLTGRSPFQASGRTIVERMRSRLNGPNPPIANACPHLPVALKQLISEMLETDCANRPSRPVDVARQLEPYCTGVQLEQRLSHVKKRSHGDGRAGMNDSTQVDHATPIDQSRSESVLELLPQPARSKSKPAWKRWIWGTVAMAVTLLLAGIVIRLQSAGGDIVIETFDPNLQIEIVRNEHVVGQLEAGILRDKTWFRAGEYEIRIPNPENGSIEIANGRFTLKRGDEQIVRITLNEAPAVQPENVAEVFGSIAEAGLSDWIPSDEQQLFLDSCATLNSRDRANKVVGQMLLLHPNASAPDLTFNDDILVGLEWDDSKIGWLWPLAALKHLEVLRLPGDCVIDYRPLKQLPIRELQIHLCLSNTAAFATIQDLQPLEVINSKPKQEFLDELLDLRREINEYAVTMKRDSFEEQKQWLRQMLLRINPGMAEDNGESWMKSFGEHSEITCKWNCFQLYRMPGLRDFSPIAIFDPVEVQLGQCRQIYDTTPLAVMPGIKRFLANEGMVFDASPMAKNKLEYLDLSFCPITSLEFAREIPLRRGLKLRHCPVRDLRPLKGKFIEELDIDATEVTDLDPIRELPLVGFNAQSTPVSDFSPLKGMNITRFINVMRLPEYPLVDNYSWLKGMEPEELLISYPRKFYLPDLEILRNLKCKKINFQSTTLFWQEFDKKLSEINAFAERVGKLEPDQQCSEVKKSLMESGFTDSVQFDLENGQVTGIHLELRATNAELWPLRALRSLKTVEIFGTEPKNFDMSPLIGLQIVSVNASDELIANNRLVLLEIESLETINGKDKQSILD